MSNHLHIVTHDVPWPADFGGVVDLYYKIKWLHSLGIRIHLHCFVKNRPQQDALNKYCETVHYYERKTRLNLKLPYIVSSRINEALFSTLAKDDFPVILEGIHCSYPLYAQLFPHRKIFLRLHNAEFAYYGNLAKYERGLLKKIYFRHEARLLKKYEERIAQLSEIWAVSAADVALYKTMLGAGHIHFLPVFLPWEIAEPKPGKGDYALYQGNLEINENEKAVLWLIREVFKNTSVPLIIAGKNPSQKIKNAGAESAYVKIIENPSEQKMQVLISNAQVNLLPSFNSTGVKLKLLNALYNGRHCLVNPAGCAGSGLDELCSIADTADEFKEMLTDLFSKALTDKKIQHRNAVLKSLYNNEANARRVIAWIW